MQSAASASHQFIRSRETFMDPEPQDAMAAFCLPRNCVTDGGLAVPSGLGLVHDASTKQRKAHAAGELVAEERRVLALALQRLRRYEERSARIEDRGSGRRAERDAPGRSEERRVGKGCER